MGLRKRTVLVILAVCALLAAAVFLTVREVIHNEYATLERQVMEDDLQRGLHAFNQDGQQLLRLLQDWAFWDDTYEFIQHPTQRYVDSNLPMSVFDEQDLDLVAYFDLSGGLVWGRMYDHVRGHLMVFPDALLQALRVDGPVLGAAGARGVSGCLPLDNGIIVLTAAPILTSDQKGPALGWLVMGRKLVLDDIREMGRRTLLDIDALVCGSPELSSEVCAEVRQKGMVVHAADDTVRGYILVQCMDGSRDLMLRVTSSRDIMAHGRKFMRINLLTLVGGMFFLGGIILLFVNRAVLSKLISIGDQVRDIGESGDSMKRVHIDGGSELVELAEKINSMLDLMNDSELFLRQLLDALDVGVILAEPDTGRIAVANKAASHMTGTSAEQLLGLSLADYGLNPPSGPGGLNKADVSVGKLRRRDGNEVPCLITANRLSGSDHSYDLISFIDVSELERTQKALQLLEDKYRAIFNNTGTASILIASDTTIVLANREFESLSGLRREQVEGLMTWKDFFLNEHLALMQEYHRLRRLSPEDAPRNYESRFITSTGEIRDVQMTVAMLPDGRQSIASIMDITERKRAEERLAHQAYHDSLTELPNRAFLLERMEKAMRDGGQLVGLLMADLDRFKIVNDNFGHPYGDRLLKLVGERIRELVGPDLVVARLSGDEFLVLVEDLKDSRSLVQLAEKLLAGIQQRFSLEGRDIHLDMSIGIAMHPMDGQNAEDILRNADMAMYRAKRMGRNTYCLYTSEMDHQIRSRLAVENELRAALLSEDIDVFYQPVVETASGRIVGAEGLARWYDDSGNIRPPSEFISVAEETGLVTVLDLQIMRKACNEAVMWGELGYEELMVSVNISAAQLLRRDIQTEVGSILNSSGIRPTRLCMELTETAVMSDIGAASKALHNVRELGVCVALDDFGTGNSSLAYLQVMPLKTLKIDRAFVAALKKDNEDSITLIKTIITMGANLHLRTVAEGVETREQYEILRDLGCDLCQGFYFARPMAGMEFRALLSESGGNLMPE